MRYCPICNRPNGKSYHDWKEHSEYWYRQAKQYKQLDQALRKAFSTMAERGLDFDFMRELADYVE